MNKLPFLLAWRYALSSTYEKTISSMVFVSFLGILIGSCSLALVISVMNGFEKITYEKMRGIHADVIVRAWSDEINVEQIAPVLEKEFSTSTDKQVIIQSQAANTNTSVIVIKGIDPVKEAQVTAIEKKITTAMDEKTLQAALQGNKILIGDKLAKSLEVSPGAAVTLLFAPDQQARKKKLSLESKKAVIAGTFKTGIDEFDHSLALASLTFLQNIFPDEGVAQINIRLQPEANEKAIVQQLKDRLHLEVYSWKDLYPALVSALKLEKYVMFFILALITLVASMNIISLLFMKITQKRSDIAMLKTMGLLVAGIIGWFLQHYPFIELPDVYYVTHLPIRMELHLFVLVFAVVMLLSLIATWVPARLTRNINISQILRFEA